MHCSLHMRKGSTGRPPVAGCEYAPSFEQQLITGRIFKHLHLYLGVIVDVGRPGGAVRVSEAGQIDGHGAVAHLRKAGEDVEPLRDNCNMVKKKRRTYSRLALTLAARSRAVLKMAIYNVYLSSRYLLS